jgi:hypothetical protein
MTESHVSWMTVLHCYIMWFHKSRGTKNTIHIRACFFIWGKAWGVPDDNYLCKRCVSPLKLWVWTPLGSKKSVLPSLLTYTWRCENITASPCACTCKDMPHYDPKVFYVMHYIHKLLIHHLSIGGWVFNTTFKNIHRQVYVKREGRTLFLLPKVNFGTFFRFKNGLVFVLTIIVMQISLFFADWLVYSGITLVFKFQAVWTTSYHTHFRFIRT